MMNEYQRDEAATSNESGVSPLISDSDSQENAAYNSGPRAPDSTSRSTYYTNSDGVLTTHRGEAYVEHLSPKKSQQNNRRTTGCLRGWWLWESLSVAVSVASIVAVVALAAKLDGTSLANWTVALAPSTIISALITISKTSMLLPIAEGLSQIKWLHFWHRRRSLNELVAFDEASRGPWGSLMLFLPPRLRSGPRSSLALGGAFLTIATLALGPFAQQIVSLKVEMVAQHELVASIPVSKAYNSGKVTYLVSDSNSDNGVRDVPPDIQAAFFNGLFHLSAPFDFTCRSGNCTWPDFASLGVCNACADVSKASEVVIQYDIEALSDWISENSGSSQDPYHLNITVSTPGGFQIDINIPQLDISLEFIQISVSGQARPNDQIQSSEIMSLAVAQVGVSSHWIEWEGEILNQTFLTNSTPAAIPITNSTVGNVTYDENLNVINLTFIDASLANFTVTECSLSWCAKLYRNVSVLQGDLQRYSIQEIPLRPTRDIPVGFDSNWTYVPTDDDAWHNGTTPMAPYSDSVYFVDDSDHVTISQFISSMFNFPSAGSSTGAFTINQAVQAGVDLSTTMKNITDSITQVIRTSRNATSAEGTAWGQDTIVRIQWAWLSLPIALVLLSALFLAAVSVATQRNSIPLWKSSLIPYFFHGVEDWDDEHDTPGKMRAGLLEEMSAMQTQAALIDLKLSRNEHGESRFRQHS